MKKDRLTIGESQELLNLGIPWYYATIIRTEVPARVVGFRDEYVFTFTNLFSLIPKIIKIEDNWAFFTLQGIPGNLNNTEESSDEEDISGYCEGVNQGYYIGGYGDGFGYIKDDYPCFSSEEPIDILFSLIKWIIEEEYIKFDENGEKLFTGTSGCNKVST